MMNDNTPDNTLRKAFQTRKGLRWLWPFYEAMESVFISRPHFTASAPMVRDSLDVKRYMMLVILALLPHYAFGVYNVGLQALLASGKSPAFFPAVRIGLKAVVPIVMVVFAVGLAWEILFAAVRKHPLSEGILVTCTLLPLTLPPTIPLWQAALGICRGPDGAG